MTMDNSSLSPEFLLRQAYDVLLNEHLIVSDTGAGQGPLPDVKIGARPFHRDECDVCDLLESIDNLMGITLESWASNLATNSGAQKGWRERPVTVIKSTKEDIVG